MNMSILLTTAEENYLKAVFKIIEKGGKTAGTNSVAEAMQTSAASATDMLKRLHEKGLVSHEKYRGVDLTDEGRRCAIALIRKHRLWEVFLLEKLGFAWHEVHDIAEQLEHVQSEELIRRLDAYLGHPQYDPHGDPIPDPQGRWAYRDQHALSALTPGQSGVVTGVDEHSPAFLQYLDRAGLILGAQLILLERVAYDHSSIIRTSDGVEKVVSEKVSQNVFVKLISKAE